MYVTRFPKRKKINKKDKKNFGIKYNNIVTVF